ncbi:MAG TPA: hypothetical protein VJT31_38890 [Rugosimonospora sp.]|nr:hypothetical protein [Rugosimonospora sp.]
MANTISAAPVGPHQFFTGMVNDTVVGATITVVCVGPTALGRPLGGQTIGVALVTTPVTGDASIGYTGDAATSISAVQPVSGNPAPIAVFTAYGDQPLPTTRTMPCGGTVTIAFVPSPDTGGRAAVITARIHALFVL